MLLIQVCSARTYLIPYQYRKPVHCCKVNIYMWHKRSYKGKTVEDLESHVRCSCRLTELQARTMKNNLSFLIHPFFTATTTAAAATTTFTAANETTTTADPSTTSSIALVLDCCVPKRSERLQTSTSRVEGRWLNFSSGMWWPAAHRQTSGVTVVVQCGWEVLGLLPPLRINVTVGAGNGTKVIIEPL